MTTPVLIHILSLDTVGGVETLYAHFLEAACREGNSIHYTCVSGKRPHTKFSKHFEDIGHRPFLEEHVFGCRLPRFLRALVPIRRGMIQEIANPTYWVYWNRIEEQLPAGKAIYYEHGAAWNVPVSKKRLAFLKHCPCIVANSEAAATLLREKWSVTDPITVVPNPLRPDIVAASSPKSGLKHQTLHLGCIGRLVPVKGFHVALHVCKLLNDRGIPTTLSIAGVGPDEQALRQTAERLNISKNVHWCGCLSSVSDFYDSLDFLLVPSIREPLGLVALEAAARGVPVIAASVDGLPEAVLHQKTGLCLPPSLPLHEASSLGISTKNLPDTVVDPLSRTIRAPLVLDPAVCANAIELLINDENLYTLFSSNAISQAIERASFLSYYQALGKIFFEGAV